MKAWSRKTTLLAGAALIVLANGVALFGVWGNRAGEPEAVVSCTERELTLPYRGYRRENSGLALALNWRVADREMVDLMYSYPSRGGTPDWLDADHMARLGFDVAGDDGGADSAAQRRYTRQLSRDVLVVLEMDGPAWRSALEKARENVARHEAASAANPGDKEFANRAKNARESLVREEEFNSRLFAIDAGLDAAALRARYPDRQHYLILKGTVRPRTMVRDKKTRFSGYVSDLAVGAINVPHTLRPGIENLQARYLGVSRGQEGRFTATIATGQRLEPWLMAIAPVAAATPPTSVREP